MKSWLRLTLIFALTFSVACSQRKPALIIDHSHDFYGRDSSNNASKSYDSARESSAVAVTKNHEITVESGDTLHSLARRYQISVRNLVDQNDLTPPYILKPGQRLTIPSSTYHKVVAGDTLYSISRLYGMNLNQLVALNDLTRPYSVRIGEQLIISKEAKKISTIKSTKTPSKPGLIARTLDKLNHFSWPMRGKIISKFGPKAGGLYNDGINIKAKAGTVVKASEDGVVAYVGNELKGYGNLVIVKHAGGWITAYAHLQKSTVERGEKVEKGTKVGLVGATGNVDSPQLYFGLRKGRDAVNPVNYLK